MLLVASLALALSLDEAWTAASAHSVEGQLVNAQYDAARTVKGAAWSLLAPKVVARGNYTRNDEQITFDPEALFTIPPEFADFLGPMDPIVVQRQQYFDANISVVQPIFSGVALPLLRATYGEVRAAEHDRDGRLASVRLGIARAWWSALVAREGVTIAEEALASARRRHDLLEQAVDIGSLAPTARLQAEIAVSRAERDLAAALSGRTAAEGALGLLTGIEGAVATDPVGARELPYASPDAAVERALDRRPSLLAARERSRSSRFVKLARGLDWLPSINGRFTYVWTQNTSAFNSRPEFWMGVVEGEWLLWDGGYRLSKQEEAGAMSRMASLAEQREVGSVGTEVAALWTSLERARASLAAAQREESLATENARIAEVAFGTGALTFVDFQDAGLAVRAARLAVLQESMATDLVALELLALTGDL